MKHIETNFIKYINENVVSSDVDEILSHIRLFNKFGDRKSIANINYRLINKGTGRLVYDLNNGYVLKLAKNIKGIAQNKNESNPRIQKEFSDVVAKVIEFDINGKYLIQEKVNPITEADFEKLTGLQERGFMYYLRFNHEWDNTFYSKVNSFVSKFGLDRFDISNISSWGERDGKSVLIDYGLTMETARKLYKVAY